MSKNNQSTFWIHFAGLQCRVVARTHWKTYFKKYFDGDYFHFSDTKTGVISPWAELSIIEQRESKQLSRISIQHNKLHYVVHIAGSPHFFYPLIGNVLQRAFVALFYAHGGLVFHASAVMAKGKAYIFAGYSGKGKTTIARLSHDLYGLSVVADNLTFVRKQKTEFYLYPFPFDQYHKHGNSKLSIASLNVLAHAKTQRVVPFSFKDKIQAFTTEIQLQVPQSSRTRVSSSYKTVVQSELFIFMRSVRINRIFFSTQKGFWERLYASESQRTATSES